MNFIARFNMPNYTLPVRAYLHGAGQEMWNPEMNKKKIISEAKDHLVSTLDSMTKREKMFSSSEYVDPLSFDFLLAVLWGRSNPGCGQSISNGNRMIDFFGYSDVSRNPEYWPGNPEVEGWVMTDGIFTMKPHVMPGALTCEDTIILLGREGEYRRKCKDLKEFLEKPPVLLEIPGLLEQKVSTRYKTK